MLAACASVSTSEPRDVSLVELIANPMKYDGQYVRVCGFYSYEFEGCALYLHREDYEHALYKNGIWVGTGDIRNVPAAQYQYCDMKYVLIQGVFDAHDHGHLGMWSGQIDQLTRMEPWPRGGSDNELPISR